MFIPIIVLSDDDGDNDSSMGGVGDDVDDASSNWAFNIGDDLVELSIWSDRFYDKEEEKKTNNEENWIRHVITYIFFGYCLLIVIHHWLIIF